MSKKQGAVFVAWMLILCMLLVGSAAAEPSEPPESMASFSAKLPAPEQEPSPSLPSAQTPTPKPEPAPEEETAPTPTPEENGNLPETPPATPDEERMPLVTVLPYGDYKTVQALPLIERTEAEINLIISETEHEVGIPYSVVLTISSEDASPALGTVILYEEGLPISGPQLLSGGWASATWTPAALGERTLTAVYTPSNDPLEPFLLSEASVMVDVAAPLPDISLCRAEFVGAVGWVYTGSAITPAVDVFDGETLLQEGIDYKIEYQNNQNAGNASILIHGVGLYSGTLTVGFTIEKAQTDLTLTVDTVSNQPTFTAAVEREGVPARLVPITGSVRFELDGVPLLIPLDSLSNAILICTNPVNWATAMYEGDSNHKASPLLSWGNIAPDTSWTVQAKGQLDGSAVLEAVYSMPLARAVPTGEIKFFANGTYLGTVSILNGMASYLWSDVPTGVFTISAVYQGDASFPSSQSVPCTLYNPYVSLGITAQRQGQDGALLTSIVAGGMETPTGQVTFYADSGVMGTASIIDGVASLGVAGLSPGNHVFYAIYSGDDFHFPKMSYSVSFNTYDATIQFDVEQNPNGSADLIAIISGNAAGESPQGTVIFSGDGLPGVSAAVGADGKAVFTWFNVPLGESTLKAEYLGDTKYPSMTSAPVTIRNLPSTVDFVVTMMPNGALSFSMSVFGAQNSAPTPTGTVTFMEDGKVVDVVPLSASGMATRDNVPPPARRVVASAIYSGDINYFPKESSMEIGSDGSHNTKYQPTVSVAATAGSGQGPATLTATVTGSAGQWPQGQVIFSKGKELLGVVDLYRGEAVYSWADAPQGSHIIYAEYRGDENYVGETGMTVFRKNGHVSTVSPEMLRQNPQIVILRDVSGKAVMVYDTTLLPMIQGMLKLDTNREDGFLSYGFNVAHLRDLARREEDGYFDIDAPWCKLRMPFDLPLEMRDLTDYIIDRDLRPSELELRLIIRKLSDKDPAWEAFSAQLEDMAGITLYQLEIHLYTLEDRRLDYFATAIPSPFRLELSAELQAADCMYYDTKEKRFVPQPIDFSDGGAVLDVAQCGTYLFKKLDNEAPGDVP